MERYGVSPRIQSKCGKIQTIKTQNPDTFHAVDRLSNNTSQRERLFIRTFTATSGPFVNGFTNISFREFFNANVLQTGNKVSI